MLICWAVLGGFVLDAIFGDPAWLPHPVVLMGKAITALEKRLRAQFPQTPQGELCGGAVLAAILPVGTFLITALVCRLAAALHPLAGLAVQMFWCAQALAARGLVQESCNVYKELQKQDLPAARKAVARIVGRDTQNLTAEGVTKAAVETVAENASDGVIAPLLYMLLGGALHWWWAAPLAVLLPGLAVGVVESTQARNKLSRNATFLLTIAALAALIFFVALLLHLNIDIR